MAELLEPRKVPPRELLAWYREAWGLLCRRPGMFGVIALATAVLVSLVGSWSMYFSFAISLLVLQYSLALTINLARRVDHGGNSGLKDLFKSLSHVTATIIVISMVAVAINFFFSLPLSGSISGPDKVLPMPEIVRWLVDNTYPSAMVLCMWLACQAWVKQWFLFPLMLFSPTEGMWTVIRLSFRGQWLNDLHLTLALVIPVLLFMVPMGLLYFGLELFHALWFLIPMTALLTTYYGIVMYVSYRHVFLGQRENKPVRATVTVARIVSIPST